MPRTQDGKSPVLLIGIECALSCTLGLHGSWLWHNWRVHPMVSFDPGAREPMICSIIFGDGVSGSGFPVQCHSLPSGSHKLRCQLHRSTRCPL